MKNKIIGIFVCMLLIGVTGTVIADWEPGDGYKMHFPQLPDPNGWDVWSSGLGDDWQCSETGPVTDIHFWISSYNDQVFDIPWIDIQIWSNNPDAGVPDLMLWEKYLQQGDFNVSGPWAGDQGFYYPPIWYEEHNHDWYYQINIVDIEAPFQQIAGEIYWLVIWLPVNGILIGWKTSQDHFMNPAVYMGPMLDLDIWYWLLNPTNPEEYLDFAFVINGQPPIPNLSCDGSLSWTDVIPGNIVTGNFEIENIGEPLSELDWEVSEWPVWGIWDFDPYGGLGLTPEAGPVTVDVEIVAPLGPEEEFIGEVKIVNIENSSDFCTIPVDLDLRLPDLDCIGELSWTDVKPGSLVTDEIYVLNDGDPHSPLDWEITEWPEWGDWSFAPSHGFDLTPEDGALTVQVFVEAPEEENTEFEGEVTIVNSEDPEDTCTIQVSLKTPYESPFLQLLWILMQRFPILWRILSSLI